MKIPLPPAAKAQLKMWRLKARQIYVNWRYRFTASELEASLLALGLRRDDVVMVHSSFGSFEGFTGSPMDVIGVLQSIVGPGGTILMPTLPFGGSALDYVARRSVFDVRKTPARTGIIPEMFRRGKGVIRSTHPTHSVAAWGAGREEILKDHHLAQSPCGMGTPYLRLLDVQGKILHLGSPFGSTTFLHGVEEILEPGMPFSPFTEEKFTLESCGLDGQMIITVTRLFDRNISALRRPDKLIPYLMGKGHWRETRIANLAVVLLKAEDVLAAAEAMAARNDYFYDMKAILKRLGSSSGRM